MLLLALFCFGCKPNYPILSDNQKLCIVESVSEVSDGYLVHLCNDSIFFSDNPQIKVNSFVILDKNSMKLEKLYYSDAHEFFVLKNDKNVHFVKSIEETPGGYWVSTETDTLFFIQEPNFDINSVIIVKPDMSTRAPFGEETKNNYEYVRSAYESLTIY